MTHVYLILTLVRVCLHEKMLHAEQKMEMSIILAVYKEEE